MMPAMPPPDRPFELVVATPVFPESGAPVEVEVVDDVEVGDPEEDEEEPRQVWSSLSAT